MLEKTKKLFFVSRPISWVNTAYPFAAGYLLSGGEVDTLFIIATLYFLGPYNLLMYGINDVFDYESDIRNPRKGGIEGMKEQRNLHPSIVWVATITNVVFLAALIMLGTLQSTIVLGVVVFLVVAYSIKVLRFKERPLLDSVTSSMHFVGPLLYALSLHDVSSSAWPYVLAFFLWGVASHAFGAVQDIVPDRKGHISSIATFFGATWTMRFAWALYAIAGLVLVFQPLPYALMGFVALAYVLNIQRYIHLLDSDSAKANVPWRRFIWINLAAGFVLTMILISAQLS